MYKSTSRAMKHAQRIDLIHPSKGYIAGQNDDGDPLASVEAMTMDQLRSERSQLSIETTRWTSELAAAKAIGDERRREGIGLTMATIQRRSSLVCAEIKRRNIENDKNTFGEFKKLVRARLGDEAYIALLNQAQMASEVA